MTSERLFQQLQKTTSGKLKFFPALDNSRIDTAGTSSLKILGHVEENLIFKGTCKNRKTYAAIQNKIFIVKGLRIDLIIGADVLFSSICSSISSTQITFVHNDGEIIIPTCFKSSNSTHLLKTKSDDCYLKPFESKEINMAIASANKQFGGGKLQIKQSELLNDSSIRVMESTQVIRDPENLKITIINTSDVHCGIPNDIEIAEITTAQEENPKAIMAEHSTDQTQREPESDLPVSEYVEQNMKLTELELDNTNKEMEGDIVDLVNFENVPKDHLAEFQRIIREYKAAFTSDRFGTGRIRGYEAKLKLKDKNAQAIAKRRPIPDALKEDVQTILDEYEKRGIISALPRSTPTKYVTNIVLIKKKDNLGRRLHQGSS